MSKNIDIVLEILKNEVDGDVSAALDKMSTEYSMTWMYQGKRELFPTSNNNVEIDLKEIYLIKGRRYEIKHIAEGKDIVMVELIESYPDPNTQKIYRTPLVLVLELEDGKIRTGRHYCDPRLSHQELSPEVLQEAYREAPTQIVIE